MVKTDITFNFHPGQKRVWQSEKRFIAMLAGSQGGKTVFGSPWLHREISRTAKSGEINDYFAVTATFKLFKNLSIVFTQFIFCF